MNPLVSVIIPCYNEEDLVGHAIDSALQQTYSNREVIVIDDGSTDSSVDVLTSYGDQIRWESVPNRGACNARNRGIELARGELIQFLDADDLLYPNKLERMVPVATEKGLDFVVFCDWERVDKVGSETHRHFLSKDNEDEVVWVLGVQLTTLGPIHWRSTLLRLGGFAANLPCAQERDLHLRLACEGIKFAHVPEILVRVRRRADGLSSNVVRVCRQHLEIVLTAQRNLRRMGCDTDARLSALAGLLARDARTLLAKGETAEARAYLSAARSLHRGGGLEHAYSPLHRKAVRVVGPLFFERLVKAKTIVMKSFANAQLKKPSTSI